VAVGGRVLGEAWIVISPDTDNFLQELTAKVKAAVTAVPKQDVKVGADTTPMTAAMTRMRSELAAVTARISDIKVGADDTALNAAVAKMLNKVALLAKQMRSMELAADPAKLDAALAKKATELAGLQKQLRSLEMGADTTKFSTAIAREAAAAAGLQQKLSRMQLSLQDAEAVYELKYLEHQAEAIRKALDKIPGDVEDTLLQRKLNVISARIAVIRSDARKIELAGNVTRFFAQLSATEDKLMRLRAEASEAKLMNAAQIAGVQAAIAATTSEVEVLRAEADRVRLGGLTMAEVTSLGAGIAGLDDEVARLNAELAKTQGEPTEALIRLRDRAADLDAVLAKAKIELAGEPAAEVKLARLELMAEKLKVTLADLSIGGDPVKLAAAAAAVATLSGGLRGLTPAIAETEGAWARLQGWAFKGGGGLWGLGSAIGGVKLWHVVLDGVIEAIIAVTGAAIAATAGAAALGETAKDVATRLNAVRTVNAALGTEIPPMTGKFDDLVKAMAPRGIEIFGGALNIVNSQSKNLRGVLEPVVDLFDKWVAQIDIWVTHQQTFAGAVTHGTTYLAQFGQIVGQITEAIHNLLSKDPGIAHYLLQILVVASGLLDAFTKLPKPIVELTIGLHGLYIWAAVLGAVFLKMVNPLVQMVGWVTRLGAASKTAAGEVALLSETQLAGTAATDAQAVGGLAGALGKAGTMARNFGAGLVALATNPFVWAAVAAAGLAYVAYEGNQADASTKRFISNMNSALNQMKASQAIPAIARDIGLVNAQIAATTSAAFLPKMSEQLSSFGFHGQATADALLGIDRNFGKAIGDVPQMLASWHNLANAGRDLGHAVSSIFHPSQAAAGVAVTNAIKAFNDQLTKLNETSGRYYKTIGALIKEHYSVAGSIALMDLAGVKAADSFEIMHQKVENLITGYKSVTGTGGALEASVNAVTFAALQQQEKVGQLNQGWDTFIKTIEGGEQGFNAFATQTEGLYQSLSNAGVKLSDSNGKVSMSTKLAADAAQGGKVSMTGLNTASLQARDTFLKTADSANQQMDALSMLANAAGLGQKGVNLLGRANKDMVASMLPAAKSSQAMTDILYALAQRGGYRGADSFKALSEWVGKTKNPMKDLDGITTQFTTDAADLTQDVKNLSIALGTTLNEAMSQAIITANGGQKMFVDFADAVLHTGLNSDTTRDKAQELAQGLVNLTGNTAAAHSQFMTFAQVGLHLTRDQAKTLWNEITGKLTPALNEQAQKTVPAAKAAFEAWAGQGGKSGLGMTHKEADSLWKMLTGTFGPTLTDLTKNKTPAARAAFEAWAGVDGKSGLGLTKKQADALWTQLTTKLGPAIQNLPSHKTITITEKGTGLFTITGPGIAASQGPGGSGNAAGGLAGGGFIAMGSGPTADDVPAMLSRGEVVVPANMVSAGAVDHLRGALPGFAAGGLVPSYKGNVGGLGPWTTQNVAAFENLMTGAMKGAMTVAMKNAIAAAMAAAAGGGVGTGSDIVSYARSFLGRIPYVWGGTGPLGADCSGFVQMVYNKFGYKPPRTSEAQGGWVTRTKLPQAGGLAFFDSPAGGPPPGHVGIVTGLNSMISQAGPPGALGPTVGSLNRAMWTGVPPGGFRSAPTMGPGGFALGPAASGSALAAQNYAKSILWAYGWGANQWPSLLALWNGESNWNAWAVNPSSGAYGIPQALGHGHPYNLGDYANQVRWGLGYISGTYGSPAAAYGKWLSRSPHWYAGGGPVRGSAIRRAAGGPVGGAVPRMAAGGPVGGAQAGVQAQYAALQRAFAAGPAQYRTTLTRQELATLAAREAAEVAGYKTFSAAKTATNLSHLGALARAELSTAADKALNRVPGGHPGIAASLRGYLTTVSNLSRGTVAAATGTSGSGGMTTAQRRYWLGAAQYGELQKYFGLHHAFAIGPPKYRTATVTSELRPLAARQAAEAAAYKAVMSGSLTAAELSHLGATARAEYSTAGDKALSAMPGGHPGWASDLRHYLGQISALTGKKIPGAPGLGAVGASLLGAPALWQKDPSLLGLLKSVDNEMHIFWKLMGSKLPKTATAAQRKTLAAWDKALERQQVHTFGLGRGGLFQQLLDSFRNGRPPPWDKFGGAVNYMIREVEGTGIKGGVNPPGTPRNSGYVPWHFFHSQWLNLLNALRLVHNRLTPAAPWKPGNLGPSHTAPDGVLQLARGGRVWDAGGVLRPGWNPPMFNATGKDEHLVPAGGGGDVHLHLTVNGPVGSQSELEDWFVRTANLMARTGKLSQAVRTAG